MARRTGFRSRYRLGTHGLLVGAWRVLVEPFPLPATNRASAHSVNVRLGLHRSLALWPQSGNVTGRVVRRLSSSESPSKLRQLSIHVTYFCWELLSLCSVKPRARELAHPRDHRFEPRSAIKTLLRTNDILGRQGEPVFKRERDYIDLNSIYCS